MILRVIVFRAAEFGFTDVALPVLLKFTKDLGYFDIKVDHASLTMRFFGEERLSEFYRVKKRVEDLSALPEFEGSRVAVAEGEFENWTDELRVVSAAVLSSQTSNKAQEPTR